MPSRPIPSVRFIYETPDRIPPAVLEEIRLLVAGGEAVGTAWVEENLRNAFLLGYAATGEGRVVGCVILKHPKASYREKIEAATGLDLSGFLERGYTAVAESFRNRHIADTLIRGLIHRASNRKIYVTIRMDNGPALRLTEKNGMRLAGRFVHPGTGREIGVFVNR